MIMLTIPLDSVDLFISPYAHEWIGKSSYPLKGVLNPDKHVVSK